MSQVTSPVLYPVSVSTPDGVVLHGKVKVARIADEVRVWGSRGDYAAGEDTDDPGVLLVGRYPNAELVMSDGDPKAWRVVPSSAEDEPVDVRVIHGCRCGPVSRFAPG